MEKKILLNEEHAVIYSINNIQLCQPQTEVWLYDQTTLHNVLKHIQDYFYENYEPSQGSDDKQLVKAEVFGKRDIHRRQPMLVHYFYAQQTTDGKTEYLTITQVGE